MTAPFDSDVAVDMLLLGGWTDVTDDVRLADKIKIKRGRSNETSEPEAPTCGFTIDNRGGKYSPRNPVSPYYPTLNRNTPLRVAIRVAKDLFARTVVSGWGTGTVGGAWTLNGLASAFGVSGGVGTMTVAGTGTWVLAYQGSQVYRDVDVAATVTMPFSDVTGGSVEPANLMLGGLSTSDYFLVPVRVTSAEAVTIGLSHYDGTVVAAGVTVAGLTYTGQALRVRAQIDGQTLRAKVWAAGQAEPYAWNVEGRSSKLIERPAGWAGIRSGVSAGNTNIPVTYSYSAFEVRSNRFAGEIASFPPEWDPSGNNVYSRLQAGGLQRRVTQGTAPLKSTYRRGNETISPPHVAYWPVEEGADATSIASGIGGPAMLLQEGKTTFATNSDFRGSAPIAKNAQTRWVGAIPSATATGQAQLLFLLSVPAAGEPNNATFSQLQTSGTAAFIDLFYGTGGDVQLRFYRADRNPFYDTGFLPFAVNGRPIQMSVELTQNGANIDWKIATFEPGAPDGGDVINGTAPAATIGTVRGVVMNPYRQITGSAFGHVAVRTQITSIFTLAEQFDAYRGETAVTRTLRLLSENGLPGTYIGDADVISAALGYQGRQTWMDLVKEAAAADVGSFYDSRNHASFVYRTRASMYNQPAALALDYTAPGHVAPPLKPVEDDQTLRNDITVTRKDGSSYQAIQTTGRLAVTDPTVGTGAGHYDDAVTLNLANDDQTPSAAGWLLSLGTVDEPRYPTIAVNRAALATVSPTLALAALMVNLDDKITIANPKPEIAPGTITQLARGYTETIGQTSHDLQFTGAPASPFEVVGLDDDDLGKLDTDTSVLLEPVTTTGTQLLVSDYPGRGWTSDPAEMPIPVTVGGEDMSVTAISALGPSFVAAGLVSEGSDSPRTPGLPAGLAEGHTLYCLAAIRNSPAGIPQMPDDWTLLVDAGNLRLFGKVAGPAEAAPTVTFTGGVVGATCHAQLAAFRNCSIAVLGAAAQLNASAQNIAYPALAAPTRRALILYIGWKQRDWTSVAAIAGATEIGEVATIIGDDAGIVWDYLIQTTPAAISAGSFTVTGGASAISRGAVVALDGTGQAMTVTRSVNGVVKTHAVESRVSLTRPATVAY